MRVIRGRQGFLFAVSDEAPLTALLQDSGDGFDWQAADDASRLWLEPVTFELWDGAWLTVDAETVDGEAGRVAFGRCLAGRTVRARGRYQPLTLVETLTDWHIERPELSTVVEFYGSAEPHAGPLFARLLIGAGEWVGRCHQEPMWLEFEEGAPRYVASRPPND